MAPPERHRRAWSLVSLIIILEGLTAALALGTVGVTAAATYGMVNDLYFAGPPSKLAYNIAIAVITTLLCGALTVYDFKTWLKAPWGRVWIRMIVQAVLVVVWAAALGTSFYTKVIEQKQ